MTIVVVESIIYKSPALSDQRLRPDHITTLQRNISKARGPRIASQDCIIVLQRSRASIQVVTLIAMSPRLERVWE